MCIYMNIFHKLRRKLARLTLLAVDGSIAVVIIIICTYKRHNYDDIGEFNRIDKTKIFEEYLY